MSACSAVLASDDVLNCEGQCVSRLRKPTILAHPLGSMPHAPREMSRYRGHMASGIEGGALQRLACPRLQDREQVRDVNILIEV
jgi:hypothetical protein